MWNEFFPISMPTTAIAFCAVVAGIACSLSGRLLQLMKALDHLRLRNLTGQIAPITATGIDFGRLQEARVVIVPQRLDREQRGSRKVSNRKRGWHGLSLHSLLTGESTL